MQSIKDPAGRLWKVGVRTGPWRRMIRPGRQAMAAVGSFSRRGTDETPVPRSEHPPPGPASEPTPWQRWERRFDRLPLAVKIPAWIVAFPVVAIGAYIAEVGQAVLMFLLLIPLLIIWLALLPLWLAEVLCWLVVYPFGLLLRAARALRWPVEVTLLPFGTAPGAHGRILAPSRAAAVRLTVALRDHLRRGGQPNDATAGQWLLMEGAELAVTR